MIQSINNKKIKEYAKLIQKKERDKTNLFLVEGEHMIKEAFNANALQELFILEGLECPIEFNYETVTQQVLNKLSNQNSNSKMIGLCKKLNLKPEKEENILLLDNVQDPGNVGTIIRTALALNYKGIILSPDSAYPFSSKVIQSSKGAIFKLPIMIKTIQEFENLKDYDLIGTLLNGEPLNEAQRNGKQIILVFGNEGHGIREEVQQLLNKAYLIPMNEIDSLNVGIAAGIFMYIFRRKK